MLGAGLAYDDTFDGAQFNAGNDKVAFQAAYGYLTSSNVKTTAGAAVDKDANAEVVYLGLNGKVGKHADVGGFYARFNDSKALGVAATDGGSAKYNVLQKRIWLQC